MVASDPMSPADRHVIGGVAVTVALLVCLFIVALPLLGSLVVVAATVAVVASLGLAAIFALSRV